MAPEIETGKIRIFAIRSGTVEEIVQYLRDLQVAYDRIYLFENIVLGAFDPKNLRFSRRLYFDYGIHPTPSFLEFRDLSADFILPQHRLTISSIDIGSPGVWEFLAALNPLLQIREYLNDRHHRRQDLEYREQAERNKLILENELIQRQILEKDNSIIRERISIMRDIGYSDEEIQGVVWQNIGLPLVNLGKHQDTLLIGGAE